MPQSTTDPALLALLQRLEADGYAFTTPTPLTHARIVARRTQARARSLRDVFGWSLPFAPAAIDPAVLQLLQQADAVQCDGDLCRCRLRVSQLHGRLYLHSAYPTVAADAVFFGPDTYRFADFLRAQRPPARDSLRGVDIGCGSGAGALSAAALLPGSQWTLTDINPAALRLAGINAQHAGQAVTLVRGDILAPTRGEFDLIVSNPPYVADAQRRAYRDGGDGMGRGLSVRIALEAMTRLAPGGRLLLYTGVAIVDGVDPFLADLRPHLDKSGFSWRYREIDPDVFGEELEQPAYAQAERIAAVGLVVDRPR